LGLQLEGKITAPRSVGAWKWKGGDDKDAWIQFSNIKGLVIQGGGLIDGQGAPWWDCFAKSNCQRPSVSFNQEHFNLGQFHIFESHTLLVHRKIQTHGSYFQLMK